MPILTDFEATLPIPRGQSSVVTHVVLSNLPVPSDATPLDQIVEFRRDPRVSVFHRQMRTKIAQMVAGRTTARDIAGEVATATNLYETYMQEYRVEKAMGVFELMIRAGAAGLVAGVSMDEKAAVFGAVAGIAVALRRRRAELMRAELDARGAELAYIVKARERFGQ